MPVLIYCVVFGSLSLKLYSSAGFVGEVVEDAVDAGDLGGYAERQTVD